MRTNQYTRKNIKAAIAFREYISSVPCKTCRAKKGKSCKSITSVTRPLGSESGWHSYRMKYHKLPTGLSIGALKYFGRYKKHPLRKIINQFMKYAPSLYKILNKGPSY